VSIPNTATKDNAGVDFENVPAELKNRRQWVVWRYEVRDGKKTKVPYNAHTARSASSTDLETWAYFDAALDAYNNGGWDGIGLVFSSGDPYAGIDLDDVRNPETGELEERAQAILDSFPGAYKEVSPSGTGVHLIIRGKVPKVLKLKWIEAYSQERFFTVTGVAL
jgi:putative DNA primase/helicase